ncbi:hypothetical protein [Deinococcus sonorensis]|uniref:Uncharacterized protein n=2 Tax=Deinococcus sonorensis TaxID=309891 RepID=A0AAU7U729_9DEIO
MNRPPTDIVTLRVAHCRAEHAANGEQYHLAVLHYRICLEAAERREDCQAMRFFALRLSDCYRQMGLMDKARQFRDLADCDTGLIS